MVSLGKMKTSGRQSEVRHIAELSVPGQLLLLRARTVIFTSVSMARPLSVYCVVVILPRDISSVSYTHLDVYKRQLVAFPEINVSPVIFQMNKLSELLA